ncbi:MAG: hypothetical protein GHCLOJNM_01469 [bacterium]|nr:hypothetical protein [bacterium]
MQVVLDLPDVSVIGLNQRPEELAREMRAAAAVKWYELGLVSQSKGAEIAGLTRQGFMEACSRMRVSPFQSTVEEIAEELARG